jgi:hypothetical protein
VTPQEIAKPNTEKAHQCALFCWANQNLDKYPCLKFMHAIPNGGLRDRAAASWLKAGGVKKGVSDIFLPCARYNLNTHGLYIEMKKPGKGRVSPEQQEFMDYVTSMGYRAVVCKTWEEARDEIITYLD